MRFLVTKNPKMALMLIPWFVPFTHSRKEIYLELKNRLTYNPNKTFVCLAIEDDLIKGVVIAYCRENDVFIWQARGKKGIPRSVANIALNGLKCWAQGKGYNRIVAMPNHGRKLYERRWGFRKSKEYKDEVYMEI